MLQQKEETEREAFVTSAFFFFSSETQKHVTSSLRLAKGGTAGCQEEDLKTDMTQEETEDTQEISGDSRRRRGF